MAPVQLECPVGGDCAEERRLFPGENVEYSSLLLPFFWHFTNADCFRKRKSNVNIDKHEFFQHGYEK